MELNRTVTTSSSITRRAVDITVFGGPYNGSEVVLGEATARALSRLDSGKAALESGPVTFATWMRQPANVPSDSDYLPPYQDAVTALGTPPPGAVQAWLSDMSSARTALAVWLAVALRYETGGADSASLRAAEAAVRDHLASAQRNVEALGTG